METHSPDDEDHSCENDIKTYAVSVISQLPHREGVPMLLDAVRTTSNPSVRSAALFWLGQSGDTRAIELFETLLRK
jgi:HEAT repeat protein